MIMTLGEMAQALNCPFRGSPEMVITGVATIETAQPGEITFLSNLKYKRHLLTTQASAIIAEQKAELPPRLASIISPHPYLTFAQALMLFHNPLPHPLGISPSALIDPTAEIGEEVAIGPYTIIGAGAKIGARTAIHGHCQIYPETEIGAHATIFSHCVVRERCRIGNRVILQNHVTIGCDGFGYAKQPDREWFKIPQTGIVIIEDDVEIGAGSTIDRATIGATVIGRGSKIDNLVQIGHGSSVGARTLLCAQVGLAGSTRVGEEVILGGQVGAAGHLQIGDRVVATAQTGIPNSIPEGKVVSGYPAIDNRDWLKSSAVFAALPELQREVRRLRERLKELEESRTSLLPRPPS
jgi:UDP-3-O-[3-hydroxymyristoyl] glucosamine N-acyltransferase